MIPLPAPERQLAPYILLLSLLFSAAFLAGTAAPAPVRQQATEAYEMVVDNYAGLSGGGLFFFLLVHNVMGSILILVSGVLVGILPVLSIASNGFFLGVLYTHAAEAGSYGKAILKVLPHGIFEIPALLVVASYGLWLGVTVLRRMRGKEETMLRFHIEHAFRRYFAVVFPLLVIAATIETALILTAR